MITKLLLLLTGDSLTQKELYLDIINETPYNAQVKLLSETKEGHDLKAKDLIFRLMFFEQIINQVFQQISLILCQNNRGKVI